MCLQKSCHLLNALTKLDRKGNEAVTENQTIFVNLGFCPVSLSICPAFPEAVG